MSEIEIEAKFYVTDLEQFAELLEQRGATLARQRHLERNWRFDRPDRSLSEAGIVLRVRTDPRATLTLKRPRSQPLERSEIQVELAEAEAANALLEALGYEVVAIYEKVRTQYALAESTIMLDELPFGNFVEVEGPTAARVKGRAVALGLDWQHRVPQSYLKLFTQLKERRQLPFRDATFYNFQELPEVSAADMQLADAMATTEPGS